MPPVIEVKVALPQGDYFFPVIISKTTSHKSYLGGYRNKMTGKIYHHASSQTPSDREKKPKDTSNLRSRETQTYETRTLSIQSYRECGTQMERIDLRLDDKRDTCLVPKRYVTAYEVNMLKKVKSIEIQRYWRGYMARCRAAELRKRNADHQQKIKEER
jgi:carboxypeptidase C (cathepsin A)